MLRPRPAPVWRRSRVGLERRLRSQIEEIVAGIVGTGRSRGCRSPRSSTGTAIESRSETFDPESKVIRSTQTRSESALTGGTEGAVTVGNECRAPYQPTPNPNSKDFHEEGRGDHELRDLPRHQDGGRGKADV